jgi:hypothetical protein
MHPRPLLCCALFSLLPFAASAQPAASEEYDVVVVSGSSGGFAAALTAGRMGARVALIEDTPVLGGMLSNGISNIDTHSYESLSGIFEEFRTKVKQYYRPVSSTDPIFRDGPAGPQPRDYRGRQSNAAIEGGRWEPHVADRIFKRMIAEVSNVTVFYSTWATDVLRRDKRVVGVVTSNSSGKRRVFMGKVIIDATHEADIAAWAGVGFRVGREPRSPLEPHAGDVYYFNRTGELMAGSTGRQDEAVVSYGLRLTVKQYPESAGTAHLLKTPPPGYDKNKYVHSTDAGGITMPGNKGEVNKNPIGNELQEINWSWPEASRPERLRLYQEFKNHALGYLYYLQHERGMKNLGLPDDEFRDNGNVPYRVFVREARRIHGEITMTEADINPFITGRSLIPAMRKDAIAIGHYPIDSKPVRGKVDLSTPDKGNGDFFLAGLATPFQVPYGAIVPLHIDGLLVPVALSATHVAFSAIRMDPTWTVLGQAAGAAAVLSIRRNVAPRRISVEQLQLELIRQNVRLMFYWDVPLDHAAFGAIQWLSVNKGIQGYPDRLFRPDQPLTRAELAVLIAKCFDLWPSVSNIHFDDVAVDHWAFREIETLFDNRLLAPFGVRPRWPEAGGYDPVKNSGFRQDRRFESFKPDQAVTWQEISDMLAALQTRHVSSPGPGIVKESGEAPSTNPTACIESAAARSVFARALLSRTVSPTVPITRGDACMLLAGSIDGR